MVFAGIAGGEEKFETAVLINSIFRTYGINISVIDSKKLTSMGTVLFNSFISELENNNIDTLVIKLSLADIHEFSKMGIKFDIIVFTGKFDFKTSHNNEKPPMFSENAHKILEDKGIAIVNIDDKELIYILRGMKHHVLTYGFNSKASITTSSIGDTVLMDEIICCLQRTISTRNGIVFEPQEYRLKIDTEEQGIHNILAAASFALVNGIDLNNVGMDLTC